MLFNVPPPPLTPSSQLTTVLHKRLVNETTWLPHLDIFGVDVLVSGEGEALNLSLIGSVKCPQMDPLWIRITGTETVGRLAV